MRESEASRVKRARARVGEDASFPRDSSVSRSTRFSEKIQEALMYIRNEFLNF